MHIAMIRSPAAIFRSVWNTARRSVITQYVQYVREGTTELLTASRKSPDLKLDGEWEVGIPFNPENAHDSQTVRSKQPSCWRNGDLYLMIILLIYSRRVVLRQTHARVLISFMSYYHNDEALIASRDAFSSAFMRMNIKKVWEETTLLPEDHFK